MLINIKNEGALLCNKTVLLPDLCLDAGWKCSHGQGWKIIKICSIKSAIRWNQLLQKISQAIYMHCSSLVIVKSMYTWSTSVNWFLQCSQRYFWTSFFKFISDTRCWFCFLTGSAVRGQSVVRQCTVYQVVSLEKQSQLKVHLLAFSGALTHITQSSLADSLFSCNGDGCYDVIHYLCWLKS